MTGNKHKGTFWDNSAIIHHDRGLGYTYVLNFQEWKLKICVSHFI